MNSRTKVLTCGLGLFATVTLAIAFVIWPNYEESKRLNTQIASLYSRMNSFARQAERVDVLARGVRALERQVNAELKLIPATPDAELLIGKLSLPIDGHTILDQTFTTGQAGSAAPGTPIAAQALPLSVEMQAEFEAIFATLRLAETMDRLVRVTSVRVERDPQARAKEEDSVNRPLLMASIGLEAVYEPPSAPVKAETTPPPPSALSGKGSAQAQAQEDRTP
jgi:hypothetical protein